MEEELSKDCYYKDTPYNEINNRYSYGLNIEGKKRYLLSPRNDKYLRILSLNRELEKTIKKNREQQKEEQKKYDEAFDKFNQDRQIKMYNFHTVDTDNDEERRKKQINNLFKSSQLIKSPINLKLRKKFLEEIKPKNDNKELIKNNEVKSSEVLKTSVYNTRPNIEKSLSNCDHIGRNKFLQKTKHKTKLKSINIEQKPSILLPIINPRKIIINYHMHNDSGIEEKDKSYGVNSQCMGANYSPENYLVKSKNRVKRNFYGALYAH